MKVSVAFLLALTFAACHSKPEAETSAHRLGEELVRLEKEQTGLDDQLKSVGSDAGRQIDLTGQKELLKSRISRLRAQLGTTSHSE
jgi:hypothetical protein